MSIVISQVYLAHNDRTSNSISTSNQDKCPQNSQKIQAIGLEAIKTLNLEVPTISA